MARDWQLVSDDRKIINYIEIKKQKQSWYSRSSASQRPEFGTKYLNTFARLLLLTVLKDN
jgi:hypothetical protein